MWIAEAFTPGNQLFSLYLSLLTLIKEINLIGNHNKLYCIIYLYFTVAEMELVVPGSIKIRSSIKNKKTKNCLILHNYVERFLSTSIIGDI